MKTKRKIVVDRSTMIHFVLDNAICGIGLMHLKGGGGTIYQKWQKSDGLLKVMGIILADRPLPINDNMR